MIVWNPPHRLTYLWHLARDRADATEVSIRFVPPGSAGTLVKIEPKGWERLGAQAEEWRRRNHFGWQSLIPHYLTAASATRPTPTRRTHHDHRLPE